MTALIPTVPNLPTKMADIASIAIDMLPNSLPVQVLHRLEMILCHTREGICTTAQMVLMTTCSKSCEINDFSKTIMLTRMAAAQTLLYHDPF